MAYANYPSAPQQTSLSNELSQLISDPRMQNAISSVRLANGSLVQLNPQRQQCDTCKNFLADKASLEAHKLSCHSICRQHKLFEPVPLALCIIPRTHATQELKSPQIICQKALDHATDPAYDHTCCFVEGCIHPERIPSGWDRLEIMEHVIRSHTTALLSNEQRQSLLQGFRRPQKRPV
jgi:hypothetical protein